MPDVFISYAREDRARAEQIARGLSMLGLTPFWDTDIPPGQTWADYIEAKLAQCQAVVVLWSAHSTKSQWVREEARMGRDKSRLIPVRLDDAPPPFGFGEVQAADLSAWRGDAANPDWQRFSQAVYATVRGAEAPMPQIQQSQWQAVQPAAGAAVSEAKDDQSPIALVAKCFRLYFNGHGRARRKEYASLIGVFAVAALICAIVDVETFGVDENGAARFYPITALLWFALVSPFTSATSRRAHDIGQSGWVAVFAPIPLVGAILALAFALIPGKPGENQYGPDPKAARV